jgi:hypothetical protein
MLLHYGDHPVIEPGELYLLVIPGHDSAARDASGARAKAARPSYPWHHE